MSALDKREFVRTAALAMAALPFVSIQMNYAEAGEMCHPHLAVFDSRIAESRAFAANAARNSAKTFDIAGQDHVHWREARAHLPALAAGGAIGMTRWTDWVTLRALLAERGLRVATETRIDGAHGTVFAWRMTQRG